MHVEQMKERRRTKWEELHETSITRAAPPGITRSDNLYMFNRYRKQESNEDKRLENEDNKGWPKEDHMRDSLQMHRELKIQSNRCVTIRIWGSSNRRYYIL